MSQYKITYVKGSKEHVYNRQALDIEEATNFIPYICNPDNLDERLPLNGVLVSIEEMEINTVFELSNYAEFIAVKELAERNGLTAEKATGVYCLEVVGIGSWMRQGWVKSYRVLFSNWLYDPTLRY